MNCNAKHLPEILSFPLVVFTLTVTNSSLVIFSPCMIHTNKAEQATAAPCLLTRCQRKWFGSWPTRTGCRSSLHNEYKLAVRTLVLNHSYSTENGDMISFTRVRRTFSHPTLSRNLFILTWLLPVRGKNGE